MQLRPYQIDIINQVRDHIRQGVRSVLIQAPTGAGKTALTAHMLGTSSAKNIPSLFIVHRRELITQSTRTFRDVGIQHGIISSGFHGDIRHLVQIASIQTLIKRLDRVRKPSLVVWDECTHIASKSWSTVHKQYSNAIHVGLTATPERLDGKGLGGWFSIMVQGPSVADLIKDGFLSPYKAYAPSMINVEGIHTRMGDYAKNELIEAVDKPTITGDAVAHYKKLASGKRAIVFCASIQHSLHVVEQFRISGIPAEHIDGDTPSFQRDNAIRRFHDGKTLVISNVDLFGEGFDLPAMEAVILLRPTQSLSLAMQQIGRVLRPSPGKSYAIILDHAGNIHRHGLPDDVREWTLADRELTKKGKGVVPVRTCPICFAILKAAVTECQYCKHVFVVTPREIDEKDGELVEVDADLLRMTRKKEQGTAVNLEQLIALGRSRGYKNPYGWARYVYQARQSKKEVGA